MKNILLTRCLRLNRLRLIVRYGQALNIYIIIYEGHAAEKKVGKLAISVPDF